MRARQLEPRDGERVRELFRRETGKARELDTRVTLRAEACEDRREIRRNLLAQRIELYRNGRWRRDAVHGAIPIAPLGSEPRPSAGEAGRMPALTRNRRFARSNTSSERAGTPARGRTPYKPSRHAGRSPGSSCPIRLLQQFVQEALCRKGPHGPRRAGFLRKELPMGSRLQGASWIARTRSHNRHRHGTRRHVRLARGRGRADQHPARTTRRTVARQPDQEQRRSAPELREAGSARHRVRSDRNAGARRRQAGVGSGHRRPEDDDRHRPRDRWPRVARRTCAIHPRGHRRRTGPASLRWHRRPEQSRRSTARDGAQRRARQGPLRFVGPVVRRRVPPRARAGRTQGGRRLAQRCTCQPRNRVAHEAAVRERPVGVVSHPTRGRAVCACEPEDVHRSRHEQHGSGGRGPRRVGQASRNRAQCSAR